MNAITPKVKPKIKESGAAAPLSFIFGLTLGVMAFKSKRVEKLLYPILLVMQTMPQYAVLVPAIVLFGIGDHAAVIITMVVATTIVMITAAWSPIPKRTIAGTNTAY